LRNKTSSIDCPHEHPPPQNFKPWKLPDDVPVIRQFRIIYSNNRQPVETSILIKGSYLYELSYHQTIR
jgi:GntR family transcriptional regulator